MGDDPSKARIFIRFETSAQKKVEENQIYFVKQVHTRYKGACVIFAAGLHLCEQIIMSFFSPL